MDDITTIATLVTTVSVAIGVIFALLELRHLTATRKTEIIMKIYERFGTREVVEAINRVGNAKFENIARLQQEIWLYRYYTDCRVVRRGRRSS